MARVLRVSPSGTLPDPALRAAVVLTFARERVAQAERWRIARWIAATGCAATIHWGFEAAAWEDEVDWALVLPPDLGGVSDGKVPSCVTCQVGFDLGEAGVLLSLMQEDAKRTGEIGETLILDIGIGDHAREIAAVLAPPA